MKAHEIKKGIYWVGAIDWALRNFHGYSTQRGSTYNAYLIVDEKIGLIDTVKHYLCDEMMARIASIIDPRRIDYVITNHVEMDHSGSLPMIMEKAPQAVVVVSPNGEKGLRKHFTHQWNMKVVKTGDTLSIGKRTVQFINAPMVHWPDSMATYMPEERILFSNDAFGQHLASDERYDDELSSEVVFAEAAKYYANIVFPYGGSVEKLLHDVSQLTIDMIAPSHGIIWRSDINHIVEAYARWAKNECQEKAVIVYDTMWHSTERMAVLLRKMFEEKGIPSRVFNLTTEHISDAMTGLLEARYICIGSPTLNNGVLPTVAAFLTYMKGLAPKNRRGIAFGSYGWGGQSVGIIEAVLEACSFEMPVKGLRINYVPSSDELEMFKTKAQGIIAPQQ